MTTLSTKTYLQFVNDVIDEAGTDLATFATDGSDWLTQSDAMMNRFKKWVNRAWREIQQEANDWHWLDETAIITINPGIMFYTKEMDTGLRNINPASIVDIDGSEYIGGLYVEGVQDLTGLYTSDRAFGYMDIRYSDYNQDVTTQGHVLDFGLKAGGFRLTRDNNGKLQMLLSFSNAASFAAASFVETGDTVTTLSVTNNTTDVVTNFTFEGGVIDSKTIQDTFVTLQISYTSIGPDAYAFLLAAAQAAVSEFNFSIGITVNTSSGAKTLEGTIRFDDIGNQCITSVAITPINYNINYLAPVSVGTNVELEDTIVEARYSTTSLSNIKDIRTANSFIIKSMFPSTSSDGILDLNVTEDAGISTSVFINGVVQTSQMCWTLWTAMLFSSAPICEANLPGIIMLKKNLVDGVVLSLYNTLTSTDLDTFTYEYQQPYPYLNYIHSWKSFNWDEEIGTDDFIESIRSTNNSTFRIISREDPGVSREVPLTYVPWDEFQNKYDLASVPPSTPRIISEDNTGRYRLYPPPDRPYTIVFDYIREPQELSDYSDVCKGLPKEYEDAVMWRALQMYGEYDEQPADAARGRLNYKNMLMTMQQELRPAFHFRPKRLY